MHLNELVIDKELYKYKDNFGEIEVVRKNNCLFLILDGFANSLINLETRKGSDYTEFMEILPYLNPRGKRALMIGLGAGSISEILKRYRIKTDVIEMNPSLWHVARKYFGYRPTGRCITSGAEDYLEKLQNRYDYFIVDAYEKGRNPPKLISSQCCQHAFRVLEKDGIFVLFTVYNLSDKNGTFLICSCIKNAIESVFDSSVCFIMDRQRRKSNISVGIFLGFKKNFQKEVPPQAKEKVLDVDCEKARLLHKDSELFEKAIESVQKAWLEDTIKNCTIQSGFIA